VAVTLPVAGENPYDVKLNAAINSIDSTVTTQGTTQVSNTARIVNLETPSINSQTGTTYTLAITDAGDVIERNNAAANTVTIPPNSSVPFPIGTVVFFRQMGAGATTVAAGAGVTIRSRGGALVLGGQYAEASASKRATDEWVLSGDIT
jgi:hypothetical protein